MARDLFPLTTEQEKKYRYRFIREEMYKGRPVYRIQFDPQKKIWGYDDGETIWVGELLIDKADLQPVSVITHMAKGVPFMIKTLLGTNIHLDFRRTEADSTITYGRPQ